MSEGDFPVLQTSFSFCCEQSPEYIGDMQFSFEKGGLEVKYRGGGGSAWEEWSELTLGSWSRLTRCNVIEMMGVRWVWIVDKPGVFRGYSAESGTL